MKSIKIKSFINSLFCAVILATLVFGGCTKSEDPKLVSGNIRGVFYYEGDGENKITILESSDVFTVVIRRNLTLFDGYTIEDVVDDYDAHYKVYTDPINGDQYIKIYTEESRWMFVAEDNTFSTPLWILRNDRFDNWSKVRGKDQYKFKVHVISGSGDNIEIAIESKFKPGFYLSELGHGLSANGLRLTEHDNKDKAKRFKVYKPKGTFIEGDPALINL
ncbi:MAG: hypothetical protein JJU28_08300 [Cyclobacteriaceae bacterium]|nr:hypothetical protein [Cyclobacteriaceae bacterium]